MSFLSGNRGRPVRELPWDITTLVGTEMSLQESDQLNLQRISPERVTLEALYLEEALRQGSHTGFSLTKAVHKTAHALEAFFVSRIKAHSRYDLQPSENRNEAAHARILIKELIQTKDMVTRILALTSSAGLAERALLERLGHFTEHLVEDYVQNLRIHLEQLLSHHVAQRADLQITALIGQLEAEIKGPLTGNRLDLKKTLQRLPKILVIDEGPGSKWWTRFINRRPTSEVRGRAARVLAEREDGSLVILAEMKTVLRPKTFGFVLVQSIEMASGIGGGLDHILTVDILKILRTVQCEKSEVQISLGIRELGLTERKELTRFIWDGATLHGLRHPERIDETGGEARQSNKHGVIA